MKQDCSIVQDLLPLYVEGMVRDETGAFVQAHLEHCQSCQEQAQRLTQPTGLEVQPTQRDSDAPLRKLQRTLLAKRVQTALLAGVFVLAVLMAAFAILSTPQYVPYTQDLLEVTQQADGSLTITFDQRVTSCALTGPWNTQESPDATVYHIEAWTSVWDQWLASKGRQTVTISPDDSAPVVVYYAQNNGQEDVLLWGQPTDGGVVTLPRLVLGAYLVVMTLAFLVLVVAWWLTRHHKTVQVWVGRLALLPLSYGVGHLIVLGFTTVSYSATRDFILIVAMGVLVYCGLLLGHRVWHLWREWKSSR